MGNGSGTKPRPRGFRFGVAGGQSLTRTDCPRWRGSAMGNDDEGDEPVVEGVG
jgi:hypothetical protein